MMADGEEKATRGSRQRKGRGKRGKGVREAVSETSEDDGYVCFALHSGGAKQTTAGWRWNVDDEMEGRTRGST